MSFGFLNALMLLGLGAAVLPPLIHLLNRRRYEVVQWGAMQFLRIGETTRRRFQIEQLLLMALRMVLIAVLVLGLAAPFLAGEWVTAWGGKVGEHPNRDVVLLLDGSASMACQSEEMVAQASAQLLASRLLDELQPGDGVALWQARQQPHPLLGELTHDLQRARQALQSLPPPAGSCDWPATVQAALGTLSRSQRAERGLIIFTDNQRYGWSDETTLLKWQLLAGKLRDQGLTVPTIRVVNVAPRRPDQPANWTVGPLRASRAVAARGQSITFRTSLLLAGQAEYTPPHSIRLEIDGQPAGDLKQPAATALGKDGRLALTFTHRFTELGSHLVSLIVEPDLPPEQRPVGYVVKDCLPIDNRADFAVEIIPALPVLLVDGEENPPVRPGDSAPQRGSDFLRDALSPARDPHPAVAVRSLTLREFTPEVLTQAVSKEHPSPPRVLVLNNIARFTLQQQDAISGFLAGGGGVLLVLGERADRTHYNTHLYAGGQGWSPAALERIAGAELDPRDAVRPRTESFFHPCLELFREGTVGGLSEARFARWWKVAGGQVAGQLSNGDPLFVEKAHRQGRVLLSAVPLDNSWRSNLPDLPAYAPLVHELVYYLAGTRAGGHNLQQGEPLLFQQPLGQPSQEVLLVPPQGPSRRLPAGQSPLLEAGKTEPGVYRAEVLDQTRYFVVLPDAREYGLTACTPEDREAVRQLVPLTYEDDPRKLTGTAGGRLELWSWLLFAVIFLLGAEVWLTRRIALNRS